MLQKLVGNSILVLFGDVGKQLLQLCKLVLRSFGASQFLPGLRCFHYLFYIFATGEVFKILFFAIHSIILCKLIIILPDA